MAKHSCGPKERILKMQSSLVKKKEAYINSKGTEKQASYMSPTTFFMSPLTLVNYGIEGLPTLITRLYLM